MIELVATKPIRGFAALHILPRLDEPRGDVIERAAALAERCDASHLRALVPRLVLRAHERRIAQHERAIARRQQAGPVRFQRVAVDDVRRLLQRNANEGLAELQAQPIVHDVVHHPQCGLRDAGRELAKLDTVELVHIHHRLPSGIEHRLPRCRGRSPNLADDLDFQQPHFPVGDDEEVAAAARGIEEYYAPELRLELPERREPATALAHPLELGAQVVHEQRLDHLEDILLGRVVRSLRPAFHRIHHRLEQRTEDSGREFRPVEAAGVQQRPTHRRVERERPQVPLEEFAVDIGKPRQVLIEGCGALVLRRVEHLEQLREPRPEIRPVLAGARLDEVEEDIARLEYPGIVGEHAEHHPHEGTFQIVAPVSSIGERIVQTPDQLGRFDVSRVLVAERPALHPEDEAERLDMCRQVREREGDGLSLVKIVKLEGLEVAHKDEARALAFRQRVEILPSLFVRFAEIAPRRSSVRRAARPARTGR